MALIQCKECGHGISKKAKLCPSCGAKNKHASIAARIVFILVFVFFLHSVLTDPDETEPVLYFSAPNTPSLELISWSCNQEHGYMRIRGEVKNISSAPLKNVMAVGEFRQKDNRFIKSSNALIEYNPILAGQTSPFKVMTSHNPAIENCDVSFKTMFGGMLRYKNNEQK